MKRPHLFLGMALTFGIATAFGAAVAQQQADQTAEQAENAYEAEDVITVYGKGRVDKGMKAFMDGDFVAAEIEFEKNLTCAERVRMLAEFAVDQSVSDGIDGEYGAQRGAAAGTRNGGFGGSGITVYQTPQEIAGFYNATPRDPKDIPERTCEDSAWQLYMIAMSQLQQGKLEEAKLNFYKVIKTSREPFLFDAHYRLALLEILDGNFDKAEERVKTLKVLQDRCVRQGERCEFRAEIDELVAYIEPALAQARLEGVTAG